MGTTGNASFWERHGAHLFFLLVLVCAALSVWYVARHVVLEDTRLTHTRPALFTQGWSQETAVDALPFNAAPSAAQNAPAQALLLKNTLPASLPDQAYLCFQTKNVSVRVFVDGKLVYTYGETPQRIYGHGVGAVWNLAKLPEHAAGKSLSVSFTPVDSRTGLAPYEFLLGGRNGIITYLMQQKAPLILVSLLLAAIGLGALLLFAAGMVLRSRWTGAVFNFALFVLLSAVWTAADSGLFQFLLHSKGVAYLLFGCSFYLLCTPFALFMAGMEPEHARLFRTLASVNSLYALIRIALYVAGVLNFETGLWILHVLIATLILIINLTLWLPVLRTRRIERKSLCLSISALTLIAAVSLVLFYANDKLNVQRNGYSSGFYWGILVFVLITIMGAVDAELKVRQQAFKADFYERRAYTDELTGLLNVKGFDDKCAETLASAPADACCALVDFDVNFFSQFNANNGIDAGDALLVRVGKALRDACRGGELCARQEADHFVCLLFGSTLEEILARIRQADSAEHARMTRQMLLLSYGVVQVTDRGISPAALRNQAVVAKRTVKGNYETNLAVYDSALHESQLKEMALLAGLEAALERDEYVMFLQPKIDIATEKLFGAEALVRHIGLDGAVMGAGPIIEALERKGFVAKLDYYMLSLVCGFLRRQLMQGRGVCPISCNFSRVHLYDTTFADRVVETVDAFSIPHRLIEIELTETAFFAGKDALLSAARRLHGHGFAVSIDDFGSGYSSLNMMKNLEVDYVKLDREFFSDFSDNRRADVVIAHTIRIAQELGITTIAEGVETEEQLAFLRRVGCDLVQGFYYSRPLPEETFIKRYLPPQDASHGAR